MSITQHLNFSIALSSAAASRATFGVPVYLTEHSVTANRLDGPYSSLSAVEAAGFTSAAAAEANKWATAIFAQQDPRVQQVYIGRRLASEHLDTALDAIEAADPGAFFWVMTAVNTPAELMALATWAEPKSKIAIGQSSSAAMLAGTASTAQATTFTFGGTPADGDYSIEVTDAWTGAVVGTATVTRSTTPATNDDLATAMRAAWDAVPALAAISAAAGGSGADVDITFDGLGNLYTFNITDPESPDGLTASDTPGTQNPGQLGLAGNFNNTAFIYHDDDTENLDGAWVGKCGGFNLDAPMGAGSWGYHRLSGVTATALTDAQKAQLKAYNVNWYSGFRFTSGVAAPGITFPGVVLSGRSIKVQSFLHWLRARLEEAALNVFLEAASSNQPAILYTDAGIARFQSAFMQVCQLAVRSGHCVGGAVDTASRITPWVGVPAAADVSTADKTAGRLTGIEISLILADAIRSVGDPSTVGLTVDLAL